MATGRRCTPAMSRSNPLSAVAELVAEGVRLARRDPTVARAFPVAEWCLREQLDVKQLLASVIAR